MADEPEEQKLEQGSRGEGSGANGPVSTVEAAPDADGDPAESDGEAAEEGVVSRFFDHWMPQALKGADAETRRAARTVTAFNFFLVLTAAGFAPVTYLLSGWEAAAVIWGAMACLGGLMFKIRNTENFTVWGNVSLGLGIFTITAGWWSSAGASDLVFTFFTAASILALLGLGRRSARMWLGITCAVFVSMMFCRWSGLLPDLTMSVWEQRALMLTFVPGASILCFILALTFDNIKNYAMDLVERRNVELARVNSDLSQLFNNMRQGVLAFDAEGVVVGRASRQAEVIFARDDLAGHNVYDLLYEGADEFDLGTQVFTWWREAVFALGLDGWKEQEGMAPGEVILLPETERERHLTLEFNPIAEAGKLVLVMMLVTDRTEQVFLARAAAAREQAHARQMEQMKRMAAGGGQMFVGFLHNASNRIKEICDLVERNKGGRVTGADVEFMFRHAHTVKGEARSFALDELEKACHGVEDRFQDLRGAAKGGETVSICEYFEELWAGLEAARAALDGARETLIEASPIGAAILEQVTVQRSDVRELQHQVEVVGEQGADVVPLRRVAERLASRPFGESVSGLSDNVDRWARQIGKRVTVNVTGKDVLVPPDLAGVLPGALTHLIRNGVDHGIEAPDKRMESGKEEFGVIEIACVQGSQGPCIRIADNGGGINTTRLVEKARANGVDFAPGREVELIFADGMSTRDQVTELSGRGVGMSAVKADLGDVGYDISTQTKLGEGTTFTMRSRGATGDTILPDPLREAS